MKNLLLNIQTFFLITLLDFKFTSKFRWQDEPYTSDYFHIDHDGLKFDVWSNKTDLLWFRAWNKWQVIINFTSIGNILVMDLFKDYIEFRLLGIGFKWHTI